MLLLRSGADAIQAATLVAAFPLGFLRIVAAAHLDLACWLHRRSWHGCGRLSIVIFDSSPLVACRRPPLSGSRFWFPLHRPTFSCFTRTLGTAPKGGRWGACSPACCVATFHRYSSAASFARRKQEKDGFVGPFARQSVLHMLDVVVLLAARRPEYNVDSLHGRVARLPDSPAGAAWAWRGPRWWRTLQLISEARN